MASASYAPYSDTASTTYYAGTWPKSSESQRLVDPAPQGAYYSVNTVNGAYSAPAPTPPKRYGGVGHRLARGCVAADVPPRWPPSCDGRAAGNSRPVGSYAWSSCA